ncbi:hypothetical protein QWZ13_02240 [Reinekea marina]|uniref:hypothetical protein n=1 Tax=Reinekea marina TaxID=1310421 RepID=UPI0025B2F42C|nr:hypothetical protein [Reinekea marina]MDN3647727.1 hypothetical protein [Reinekea marina]
MVGSADPTVDSNDEDRPSCAYRVGIGLNASLIAGNKSSNKRQWYPALKHSCLSW